jgi:hypothetical protein
MPTSLIPRVAAATAVLAAISLSGCSSSGSKSAAPTTTVYPVALKARFQAALLAPADVGAGFTAGTWIPRDPSKPQPCGQVSIDRTYPPVLKVGAQILGPGGNSALNEDVASYVDQATADKAVADGIGGLTCTQGTFYASDGTSTTAQLTGPTDVTSQVGGRKAAEWQLKGDQFQGVLIAIEDKSSICALSFLATAGSTAAATPDPVAVAKKALQKLDAA